MQPPSICLLGQVWYGREALGSFCQNLTNLVGEEGPWIQFALGLWILFPLPSWIQFYFLLNRFLGSFLLDPLFLGLVFVFLPLDGTG